MAETKPKILVADDEQDTLAIFQDILEEDGYQVITASEGQAVLDLLEREKPNLLILDLRMPRLDGERILHQISGRGLMPGMKVIVLTGFSDFGVTRERISRKFGGLVCDYLEKPIDVSHIKTVVSKRLSDY